MDLRGKLTAITVALILAAGAGLWSLRHHADDQAATGSGDHASDAWGMLRPGALATHDAPPEASSRSADQVRARLFRDGSFAGTEPSGDWCVNAGKLTACAGLRQRFEYYILGLGEVSIDDIRLLVADEATRANGKEMADQIMAIWAEYWQLRTHEWRNKFVQNDRSTWLAVFDEQRQVRRQILGADWAQAFYGDDEQHFKAYYAQLESGAPPPPDPGEPVPQMAPGKDPAAVHAERVARYGPAAADRLAKADEEWADWERRLAAARVEWARLKDADNLSEAQRKQEMAGYVQSHFKPDETLRVQALLSL
jgi:lipase chaperone LimK